MSLFLNSLIPFINNLRWNCIIHIVFQIVFEIIFSSEIYMKMKYSLLDLFVHVFTQKISDNVAMRVQYIVL